MTVKDVVIGVGGGALFVALTFGSMWVGATLGIKAACISATAEGHTCAPVPSHLNRVGLP